MNGTNPAIPRFGSPPFLTVQMVWGKLLSMDVTTQPTKYTVQAHQLIARHRPEIEDLLAEYGAEQPKLFGSVARGEATPDSDIDILVELNPKGGNLLWRAAGLTEGLREILGVKVDLFCPQLMKPDVAKSALTDAVAI